MTEPTRDLVDRTELRRQIEADANGRDDTPWRNGWCSGQHHAIELLDAMPAAECPRGWTRDEVLHELDTHPGAECEAQGVLSLNWCPLPRKEIESWHPEVRRYDVRVVLPPVTVWVPLTKLDGRTLPGEIEPVDRIEWVTSAAAHDCRARWRWHPKSNLSWLDFPDGTLNLETGMVEVLAEEDA